MGSFPTTPKAALDALLEGQCMAPSDLDALLAANHREGQYLEYKDARELEKPEHEAKATIKRCVAAFANSLGGILLIGIAEGNPPAVSPCRRTFGRQPLEAWVRSLLSPLAPRLAPPPTIQIIEHAMGSVLVLAVDRAPTLVPLMEGGDEKYYLRFGDENRTAPSFLISDLLLGRRQIPVLEVLGNASLQAPNVPIYSPIFGFTVENVGMVTAEQVQLGMVCWSQDEEARVNSQLLRSVDFTSPASARCRFSPQHRLGKPSDRQLPLPPFARHAFLVSELKFPAARFSRFSLIAAVYVLSRGAPPLWFEYSMSIPLSPDGCEPHPLELVIGRRPRASISEVGG
jgi:hypothetical protein